MAMGTCGSTVVELKKARGWMRLCDCSVAHLSRWGSRDQGGLEGELGNGGVLTAGGESQDSCLPGAGKERFPSSGEEALTGVSAKRSCGLIRVLRVEDASVSTCKKSLGDSRRVWPLPRFLKLLQKQKEVPFHAAGWLIDLVGQQEETYEKVLRRALLSSPGSKE